MEESATTFGKTVKDAFTGHHHDEAVHAKKEEILREQQKMGETLSEKLDKNIAAAAEKKDEVVKAVSEKAHSFNKDVEGKNTRSFLI